jgi:hypothetical protein
MDKTDANRTRLTCKKSCLDTQAAYSSYIPQTPASSTSLAEAEGVEDHPQLVSPAFWHQLEEAKSVMVPRGPGVVCGRSLHLTFKICSYAKVYQPSSTRNDLVRGRPDRFESSMALENLAPVNIQNALEA